MARIRTIKPEFWASEQVMECSTSARLLFVGMWNFCDDGGNHPASFKTLKAEVFPGDDITADAVQSMVGELIENGLVVEYEAAGKQYLHVTGWFHQKIDKPTIKHPAYKEPEIRQSISDVSTDVQSPFDDHSTTTRRPLDDSSPPEGKGREGSKPSSSSADLFTAKTESASPVGSAGCAAKGFAEFWAAYPKKVGKGDAERKWKTQKPPLADVLTAVKRQSGSEQWRKEGGQFIPNPATWLHQRRWEDEPSVHPPGSATTGYKKPEWAMGAI